MRWLPIILIACLVAPLFAQGTPTDDRIYDEVREKLTANRDIKAGRIQVSVHGAVVTLTGSVENEKQKNKAEKVAKKVKGVKSVTNQLSIVTI